MVDDSGLFCYNLTSPNQLTQLLIYLYSNDNYKAEFLSVLPTGGWNKTLKNRLVGIENERGISAKTGSLSGVSCLSDYVFTKSREPLAFSIMMNGYVGESEPFKQLQDKICKIMVRY
jgi:D-alanyl-D-alanine carboxypeptidase/D-alanyl-D-alanine-endopeptidase (penicillin-binding protein 4)